MSGAKILAGMAATVWAITEAKLSAILEFIEHRAIEGKMTDEQIRAALGDVDEMTRQQKVTRFGPVSVMSLTGIISQKANLVTRYSGGTSTEQFSTLFREQMADNSVKSIILDVDSPGGSVYGLTELSKTIYDARGQGKRIISVSNPMAASAAYWIASAAEQVFTTPSGEIGSVGAVAIHVDESARNEKQGYKVTIIRAGENKFMGSGLEPLTEQALGQLQSSVDRYRDQFVADVARNRGNSKRRPPKDFGAGLMFGAEEAAKNGMGDGVATLQKIIDSELTRIKGVRNAANQFTMARMEGN